MYKFIDYLNGIEKLTKEKKYDEAWKLANKGILELAKSNDEMWFMLYYQMAIILSKEKKWQNALEKMGYVIHYLGGLDGITHEKFILRLLKKIRKEDKFDEYVKLAIDTKIKDFGKAFSRLISD